MSLITENRAKELVEQHKTSIQQMIKEIKAIKDERDRDYHISQDRVAFFNKINGRPTKINIRVTYDLKRINIGEEDYPEDSYYFNVDELFPKRTIKKEAGKVVETAKKATKTTTRTRTRAKKETSSTAKTEK